MRYVLIESSDGTCPSRSKVDCPVCVCACQKGGGGEGHDTISGDTNYPTLTRKRDIMRTAAVNGVKGEAQRTVCLFEDDTQPKVNALALRG